MKKRRIIGRIMLYLFIAFSIGYVVFVFKAV